jgi:hypothetical protein
MLNFFKKNQYFLQIYFTHIKISNIFAFRTSKQFHETKLVNALVIY